MASATKIRIKKLSKVLGLREKAVIDQAVSLLFKQTKLLKQDLKKESDAWDNLSDELWRRIKD